MLFFKLFIKWKTGVMEGRITHHPRINRGSPASSKFSKSVRSDSLSAANVFWQNDQAKGRFPSSRYSWPGKSNGERALIIQG